MGKEGKVYRIYNADKTAWVDVLRFNSINFITNNGKQETLFVDWTDGETEPGRLYEERTLLANATKDPPIPPVKINAIKSINFVKGTKEECWEFVNDPEIATEQREYKYFYAYSLESNDPGKKGMAWDDYKKGLRKATADNTTIVSGMVSGFRVKKNDKEVYYAFETDEITEAFEPTADDTITASVYLDPFQVIVGTSTEEPKTIEPKYFWLYSEFVYDCRPEYPGTLPTSQYPEDTGNYRPGTLLPPNMTAFHSYYAAGGYWGFIQFPYSLYDPTFVADRELVFSYAYDKDGMGIWFYDYNEQKAWDAAINAKLATSMEPHYPLKLQLGFNVAYSGWFDTDPETFSTSIRNGGVSLEMTYYGNLTPKVPDSELPGELSQDDWYIDPPSLWMLGYQDTGTVDWWTWSAGRWVDSQSSAVPISQTYEEGGRIDFSITASYDGQPLEIIGWNCSRLPTDVYSIRWYGLDPLEGPPYYYANPKMWFRVLCKLPDKKQE